MSLSTFVLLNCLYYHDLYDQHCYHSIVMITITIKIIVIVIISFTVHYYAQTLLSKTVTSASDERWKARN